MKWNEFKDKLQKNALQERVEIDVDALWGSIEPEVDTLNKKKRKSFIYFIFLFGISLLIIFSISFIFYSNFSKNNHETPDTSSLILMKTEDLCIEDIETNKLEYNKSLILNQVSSKESEGFAALSSSNQNNVEDITMSSSSSSSSMKVSLLSKEIDIVQETNLFNPEQVESDYDSQANISLDKKNQQSLFSDDENNDRSQKKPFDVFSFRDSYLNPIKGSIDSKERVLSMATEFVDPSFKGIRNKYSSASSLFKIDFDIRFGLSYALKTLESKTQNSNQLLSNRNNYESMLETIHYGFQLNLKHKSNIGIGIGLEQTKINELYTYQYAEDETRLINGVVVRRINFDGDTINIEGEILETTSISINKQIYNTYTLLDIPILFSYSISQNRWEFDVEAGLVANVSLKTKGIIPDENLQDQNILTNQEDIFKSGLGISYQAGIKISRSIHKNMKLFIAPRIRYFPTEFTLSTYELSQNYTIVGGNVGLTFHIQ